MNDGLDIRDALTGPERGIERAYDTFYAHHLGFCRRQLYLSKLGLKDTTAISGRLSAHRLVQEHFEGRLADEYQHVDVTPRVTHHEGDLWFVGRPTCYDRTADRVFHVKPRNGWYKFSPPISRHLDQLHVYMRALDAADGGLVYVSMADLRDMKLWPADEFLAFDDDRFADIVRRAEAVRNEIVEHGVATSSSEIPFSKCGCYLCQSETLAFDDAAVNATPEEADAAAADSSSSVQPSLPDGGQALDIEVREDDIVSPDTYHVPEDLRELDIWVVWDEHQKIARAPWQEGTMYPCRWAADGEHDPRRPFEKARMVSELPVEQVHKSWPFPDGDDLPETVTPAVLLPHEGLEPPVTVIDFDDVRDPDTGIVSGEVLALLDRLDGYAELSRSGRGIHVYVRGDLPNGETSVSGALGGLGSLEMYDHSRFVGSTWRHLSGTPLDRVPEAEDTIAALADRYAY